MRVGPVLRHNEIGSEGRGKPWQHMFDGTEPGVLARAGLHRQVDRRPGGLAFPELVDEARAGEQGHTRLVDREGEHPRIVPVHRLDPVAVMDVEIDIEHPEPGPPRSGDRQGGIVVDTEPRGTVRHRMVQAPARVEGMGRLADENRLDGPDAAAGHRGRSVMHARERRRVARPESGLARTERRIGAPPNGADVGRVMDPGEDLVRRGLRGEERGRVRAHRREELDAGPEPPRRQGV